MLCLLHICKLLGRLFQGILGLPFQVLPHLQTFQDTAVCLLMSVSHAHAD